VTWKAGLSLVKYINLVDCEMYNLKSKVYNLPTVAD
jgi:hypothetical protein